MALSSPATDAGEAEDIAALLKRGLVLRQAGDLVQARNVFENALRLDGLPPDLQGQVDAYAGAAARLLAGGAPLLTGYVVGSLGGYREDLRSAGFDLITDRLFGIRIGGRATMPTATSLTVNASFDYRFRRYDDLDRRDDSDLRWGLNGSKPIGNANLVIGVRGWASARGGGITRNDAGFYTEARWAVGHEDQVQIGAELRRRSYPAGRLRYRSRDIVELMGSWTHGFADGRASFRLAGHGGRSFATFANPDGDTNFYGASPSLDVTITDHLAAYAYGWWQNDRYAIERLPSEAGDGPENFASRRDNLYEVGAGLLWKLAPQWEAGPNIIYIRDRSNESAINYSSIEAFLTIRRDF